MGLAEIVAGPQRLIIVRLPALVEAV